MRELRSRSTAVYAPAGGVSTGQQVTGDSGEGPNIMNGCDKNPDATVEMIDSDVWFHASDVGMFDPQGHLMTTDRKKHFFVSSSGMNIAPQPIQNLSFRSRSSNGPYCWVMAGRFSKR